MNMQWEGVCCRPNAWKQPMRIFDVGAGTSSAYQEHGTYQQHVDIPIANGVDPHEVQTNVQLKRLLPGKSTARI